MGDYAKGLEEFGKRGEKLTKSITPLKRTGGIKYYDNAWGGNQYIRTKKVFNKGLAKGIAKKTPIIGHIMTANEIYSGFQADGNSISVNTAVEVAGAVGSYGRGAATIGTLIFPGLDTLIGGVEGTVLGSWGGETATESATKAILKP